MASRSFSATAYDITVAGATTLVALRPAAATAVEIFEVRIGFGTNATSVQTKVQLVRQAVGSVALTTITPTAYDEGVTQASTIVGGTAGAAGTVGINASTEGGARTIIAADVFNHTTGFLWTPGPDGPIRCSANSSSMFAVWFPAAPATLTGWTCTVSWVEL